MASDISFDLAHKIKKIKLILMDVDGVMTDGSLIFGSRSEELKQFNIQDGLGITMARMTGLKVGLITGRKSELVSRRAKELKMDIVVQDCFYKLPAYTEILRSYGLSDEEVCFIGDDLLDFDVMERAGLSVSPANGRPEIKAVADIITLEKGGHGAVRKVIDTIIKVQGKWGSVLHQCRWQEEDR